MSTKKSIKESLNPKLKLSTYTITVYCCNCGEVPDEYEYFYGSWDAHRLPRKIEIPKGKPAQPFLDDIICKVCNCKGFIRPKI